ncbi:hypothetical protein ABH924_004612 [Arthrobacter sp. GAS37]|uniref:hypothetical protein n=1 Tax=Arthrobacter sp. GAS37 TaxID=3156261 RepID=UPI0038356FE8
MNKKVFLAVAAIVLLVLVAAGFYWRAALVSDQKAAAPAPSPSPSCSLSCQDVPQANYTGPASLPADADSEKAGVDAAVKVMGAYTDVAKSKDAWFQALAPLLTTGYAQDAQYIQPSRLPVRKITTAPSVVPAAVPDGHQIRVKFGTNAGDWVVIMTRAAAGAPWLAANVLPAKDAQ